MEKTFINEYQFKISSALRVIRIYDWLLDSFVLDFFTEDHWNKLPESWRNSFQNIEPPELGALILDVRTKKLLPLSFLALKKCLQLFSIPRASQKDKNIEDENSFFETEDLEKKIFVCANHPRLKNIFVKHVKKKKRHEISLISNLVKEISEKEKCYSVVDIGSGLGHLVRTLSYKHELSSVGIEAQSKLTKAASELDDEFEYTALKCIDDSEKLKSLKPHHINIRITSDLPGNILIETIKEHTGEKFGLVGLHPCGDLGPLLMKLFMEHQEVKYLCIVGCCFMKLSCDESQSRGYPLSKFVGNIENKHLSYESREIACHAIESYCERLKRGLYEDLQVHTYRALLEKILVSKWPSMKHLGLRSIKHHNTLTFTRYCEIATERLGVKLSESETTSELIVRDLSLWKRVVIFYTLRLMLAPLVESVILMDRLLYLQEHSIICDIKPLFDPQISPRNHILTARKTH